MKDESLNDDIKEAKDKLKKYEEDLKKKFDDPSAPYAIAWAQYNKEKNK